MKQMEFNDSEQAFNNAIVLGILSSDKKNECYAGNYMYMYTAGDEDYFKHIVSRGYIKTVNNR